MRELACELSYLFASKFLSRGWDWWSKSLDEPSCAECGSTSPNADVVVGQSQLDVVRRQTHWASEVHWVGDESPESRGVAPGSHEALQCPLDGGYTEDRGNEHTDWVAHYKVADGLESWTSHIVFRSRSRLLGRGYFTIPSSTKSSGQIFFLPFYKKYLCVGIK